MPYHSVITIRSGDNFIYLYQYDGDNALVVDPGTVSCVLNEVDRLGFKLTMILATHHHSDHTGGITELKSRTGCTVIAGDSQRISGLDRLVGDGDIIEAGKARIQVIATPGHTRTSVCYCVQPSGSQPGILWTGDTLFVSGCGRLLECEAGTMYASLMKLAALPDETLVYCGHDYTEENCRFAVGIEQSNPALSRKLRDVQKTDRKGRLTVPSTIAQEKETNPFLRASTAVEFAELRRRKDSFG